MSRVLITGSAGQVGSCLVKHLLNDHDEVRGLILPDDPSASRLDGLEMEIVEGTLLDPDVAGRIVEGVDVVVHTANLVGPLPGMSQNDFFANNVQSTYNLAYAASRKQDAVERIVYISSSAVYPNDVHQIAPAYNPIDESHPMRPVGTYGISKLIGEQIIEALARETGLHYSFIRPSGVVSQEAALRRFSVGFVITLLKIGQKHRNGTLYMADGTRLWEALERAAPSPHSPCAITDLDGRPWLDQPVHVNDLVHGIVCALKSQTAIGEAFNIAAPRRSAFTESANYYAEATGEDVFSWKVPVRWMFDLEIAKAKGLIGYQPEWDFPKMIDSALEIRRGNKAGA